jgi:uncharacterized membrane protein
MNPTHRTPAVLAYLIPVIGWLYVYGAERKNPFAMFHLKQALGLFVFLAAMALGWGVIAWVLMWIPYAAIFGIALFAIVIAAYAYGLVAWLLGMSYAAQGRAELLPLFGGWADRLPLR